MGIKEQVSAAFCVRPRITAGVLFLFGLLESSEIWQKFHSAGTIVVGNGFAFAPLCILFGLAGLIEPRFIYHRSNSPQNQSHQASRRACAM